MIDELPLSTGETVKQTFLGLAVMAGMQQPPWHQLEDESQYVEENRVNSREAELNTTRSTWS